MKYEFGCEYVSPIPVRDGGRSNAAREHGLRLSGTSFRGDGKTEYALVELAKNIQMLVWAKELQAMRTNFRSEIEGDSLSETVDQG